MSAVVAATLLGGAMGSVRVVLHAQAAPQGAAEARPAFDVASVKPNRTVNPPRAGFRPDGFEAVNATARQLISLAYNDPRNRVDDIVDGPSWLDTERFDVTARGAVARGGDPRQGLLMLQSLLADRFNLRVHRALQERPVYRLVVERDPPRLGPGLRRAPLDCSTRADQRPAGTPGLAYCGIDRGPGRSTGRSMPIALLADTLSSRVGRRVIDGTSLSGEWDWDLEWTPAPGEQGSPADADAPPPRADGPSIFSAVQEQLGLRLESGRAPLDVLVIDSIERPSAN